MKHESKHFLYKVLIKFTKAINELRKASANGNSQTKSDVIDYEVFVKECKAYFESNELATSEETEIFKGLLVEFEKMEVSLNELYVYCKNNNKGLISGRIDNACENLHNIKGYVNERVLFGTTVEENKHISYNWFKVALLFANGEMDSLMEKHNKNYEIISKKLYGNKYKSFRPYITDTANNNKRADSKNIYKSEKKLKIVNDYCDKHGIQTTKNFKKRYSEIQSK